VAILAFTLGVPKVLNGPVKLLVALTSFVLFGAFLRTIAFVGPNPRDYIEAARFVPLILIYSASGAWRRLRIESIVDAAFAYLTLDAVASVLQFTQRDLFGFNAVVTRLYSAEYHYSSALLISRRALGLSPGPGQHGAMLFLLAVLMLYGIFAVRSRLVICLLGFSVAVVSVLLSQSQTAFVVTTAVAIGILILFLVRGDLRSRLLSGVLFAVGGVAAASLIVVVASKLRYLFTLFVYGLGRSSYVNRQQKWHDLISLTFDRPLWFPVGWGKDYFGPISGAMDSDLLYIYCVYGIVVFGAFWFLLLRFLGLTLRRMIAARQIGSSRVLLFFLLLGGFVFSWPNAFFTSSNILVILVLVHMIAWWEENTVPSLAATPSPSRGPNPDPVMPTLRDERL
jgi:hypothetical protein